MFESYYGGLRYDTTAPVPPAGNLPKSSKSLQSLLVWGGHCTECAMPACYAACDLYNPRHDLHCDRFNGNARVMAADNSECWMLVRFGKWARLQASGPIALFDSTRLRLLEQLDDILNWAILRLPARYGFKTRLANFWMRKKPSIYGLLSTAGIAAVNQFTAQAFNPSAHAIGLTLSIRDQSNPTRFCEFRILVSPGFSDCCIDLGNSMSQFEAKAQFWVALTPDANEENIDLYFRDLGFSVRGSSAHRTIFRGCACCRGAQEGEMRRLGSRQHSLGWHAN